MSSFPVDGIMPKRETGSMRFLEEHPEFDGRGVIVGIMDTGVDPGAAGLQLTSDGKPKIVDIVECTGSGDVSMGEERELSADFTVEGLTGRTLRLHPDWSIPTRRVRLGVKRAFELFPSGLLTRVKKERREAWDKRQGEALDGLQRELEAFDAAHPSPAGEEKAKRDDIASKLAQLRSLMSSYDDPGPVYDCVAFHDGYRWRAVVDTTESGDLRALTPMTNYREEHQFARFSDLTMLNYCVNIYDEGHVLSIACDVGSHGTHVASIVAGNFPGHPEQNGVAPGAQIVALKIGDTRLGSMETGQGLTRGLIAAVRAGCHVINMSYGEPSSLPNDGAFMQQLNDVVRKHGIVFVSSAGNNGPALSTVGAPGGTGTVSIGVAAMVTPTMMEAEYALRRTRPPTPYTWTSRGPVPDGALGVTVIAPGAAFTSVCNWTLTKAMLMNGTSMSSPNCAGCVALLRCAAQAMGLPWSPPRLRAALTATATSVPDTMPFEVGAGLVQVPAAFDHLRAFASVKYLDAHFRVRLPGLGNARGIYLREPSEVTTPLETSVMVTPQLPKDAPQSQKLEMDMRLALQCDAAWVECPSHLLLMHDGRSFGIRVDPTSLPRGVHYAEVRGVDEAHPECGPIFRVPITVVIPTPVGPDGAFSVGGIPLAAGDLRRWFLDVPMGAVWADVLVRTRGDTTEAPASPHDVAAESRPQDLSSRLLVLHCVQLRPDQHFRVLEKQQYLRLPAHGGSQVVRVPCVPGRTMEVVLGQFWSSMGSTNADVEVVFRGVQPNPPEVHLTAGTPWVRVELDAVLRGAMLKPSASLDTLLRPIFPASATLSPLGPRDVLPNGQQDYRMVLGYQYSHDAAGSLSVTPRLPLLNGMLYDSPVGAQLVVASAPGGQIVGTSDAFPSAIKLPSKGKYEFRVLLRHEKPAVLEGLKDMPLWLETSLGSAKVPVPIYRKRPDGVAKGSECGELALPQGGSASVYVYEPSRSKLPSAAQPGDVLSGVIRYCKPNPDLPGEGTSPSGFRVTYVVPPVAPAVTVKAASREAGNLWAGSVAGADEGDEAGGGAAASEAASESTAASGAAATGGLRAGEGKQDAEVAHEGKAAEDAVARELEDALRDTALSRLERAVGKGNFDSLYNAVADRYPGHRRLLLARMRHLNRAHERQQRLREIVRACDEVLHTIDAAALAAHFGVRVDEEDEGAKRERRAREADKTDLVAALECKTLALCALVERPGESVEGVKAEALAAARELKKWADVAAAAKTEVAVMTLRLQGNAGQALARLQKGAAELGEDHPTVKRLASVRTELLRTLGWNDWVEYQRLWDVLRSKHVYPRL